MTTTWGPLTYPTSIDSYFTSSTLVDNDDQVVANHPNSIGAAILALETKLGIDNGVTIDLGALSFLASGLGANPSANPIPTIWVDNTAGSFILTYSYNGVDTQLLNQVDVTLAASATTGGMSISTQEIGNQAASTATNGYVLSTDWTIFNDKDTPAVYAENLDIDTGIIETVDSFNPAGDGTIMWAYQISDDLTNMRCGTVLAVWDDSAGTVDSVESTTAELGSTAAVVLSVDYSASEVRLRALPTGSSDWKVRVTCVSKFEV